MGKYSLVPLLPCTYLLQAGLRQSWGLLNLGKEKMGEPDEW